MKALSDTRVIVIEDHLDNLELITALLQEDVGIQHCHGWVSGQAFFRWFYDPARKTDNSADHEIDLILLDLQIPRESGYEVFKHIQGDPQLMRARVVAVTANVMQSDVEQVQAAGFHGFIGKPISVERFPEQIKRILAHEAVWEPR